MGIRRQRWCCYWISSPILPYSLFLLLLSLSFPPSFTQPTNNTELYYDHCANSLPFQCGNIQAADIKYPFWAPDSGRPEFCGHPGFNLTCQDGDKLMISIGDDDHKRSYHVMKKIDYQDRVLHVIDAQLLNDATTSSSSWCPEKLSNTTLDFSLFSYLDGDGNYYKDINLTLFLNCKKDFLQNPLNDLSQKNPLNDFLFPITGCYNNDFLGQFSYFTWQSMIDEPSLRDLYDNCTSIVLLPVYFNTLIQGMFAPDNKHVNYASFSNALSVGFGLTWNVGNGWCDEECLKSGGICGSNITDLKTPACFCPKGTATNGYSCTTHSGKKKTGIIIGGVLGGLVAGIFMVCCLWWFCSRRKRQQRSSSTLLGRASPSDPSSMKDPEYGSTNYLTHIFRYQELEEATSNFAEANELGDGGFGTVYKGILRDGRTVAVKRLYENNYKRVEQFANEILILSRLRHTNLVILYGCTSRHSRELLLVYEFVPNGTVADHLHGPRAHEGSLTWPVRMSIAIETADALAYLHAVKPQIIHRDVKTNNILLDNNFHVKVADFGLSRLFPAHVTHVSTAPQGTPGYVDPEYHQCYQLTEKSDVYSFGVVLVELISSKPAVDITRHRHEINLANMAINKIQNSELDELIDPALGYETDYGVKRMITLVAELAFRCLQGDGDLRPTIREALEVLREIERGGSKAAEDDIPMRDDAGLLKSLTPDSPDTVMDKWSSKDTTPNTSK